MNQPKQSNTTVALFKPTMVISFQLCKRLTSSLFGVHECNICVFLQHLVRLRWEELSSEEHRNFANVAVELMSDMANPCEEWALKSQTAALVAEVCITPVKILFHPVSSHVYLGMCCFLCYRQLEEKCSYGKNCFLLQCPSPARVLFKYFSFLICKLQQLVHLICRYDDYIVFFLFELG